MRSFFSKDTKTIAETKNWYKDRYQTVLVQRNLCALIIVLCLTAVIISVFTVKEVTLSKTIEPFVIEVEAKTGVTNVIRPLVDERISGNDAIRKYFVMKYVNARETYNNYDYEYQYFTVTRLMSSTEVYNQFRRGINIENPESPVRLGARGNVSIKVKSISFDPVSTGAKGFLARVHFTRTETSNQTRIRNYIASINFIFADLRMTLEERYINPLGFQVIGYRLDEEIVK